jgi:TPR repeat protein
MRHRLTTTIAVLCLAGTGSTARAGDPPEVKEAKKACDAGQMEQCYRLGSLYYKGTTVGMDLKKAAGLFRKACDAGQQPACRDLAQMYEDGDGVKQDTAQAFTLREKLCAGGDGELCFKLAEDNPGRAAPLYEQACNAGYSKACYSGGQAFSNGSYGATKDLARAAALYQKGCDAGDMASCYNGGVALSKGEGAAKDAARAAALFTKACETSVAKPAKGLEDLQPTACYNLAIMYQRGEGVKQNQTRARSLFETACKAKISGACDAADSARTLEKHPEEAASGARGGIAVYMMKSCDNGEAFACRQIAEIYLTGNDWLPKNPARAPEYFKRANTLNTAHCDKGGKGAYMACMELSRAYEAGTGVAKDAARKAALEKKANGHAQVECDKGSFEDCLYLGLAYQWGNGVPKDVARAAALFKKACDGGLQGGCAQQKELGKKP